MQQMDASLAQRVCVCVCLTGIMVMTIAKADCFLSAPSALFISLSRAMEIEMS